MSDVPGEVLYDILSRLPVKPLLRFRCVSKPWASLIDCPDFINFHLNRSIKDNSNRSIILRRFCLYSLDFDSLNNLIELDHPLKCPELRTEILGSCNGLLCLSNGEEDNILWNPSTRKYQKLSVPSTEFPRGFCPQLYVVYGFGYDHVNDDYKVVRMIQFYGEDDDSFDSEVKVYSLKTNSWRRIRDFPYYLRYKRANGMLVSGALHWVVSRKPESDISNLIAAFDLGTEEYRLVPQPEYLDDNFHMNLGVLGGCLCVVCNYLSCRVDIWVMKNYGVKESWTNLISVAQGIEYYEFVRPIAYSKSGEQVLLNQDNHRLCWYDLKRKAIQAVWIHGMPSCFEADVCLGSLVQLSGGDGSEGKQQRAPQKRKKSKTQKKRDDFLSKGFKLLL